MARPPEQGHNGGPSGVGKNNMVNASTPGGQADMAASAVGLVAAGPGTRSGPEKGLHSVTVTGRRRSEPS